MVKLRNQQYRPEKVLQSRTRLFWRSSQFGVNLFQDRFQNFRVHFLVINSFNPTKARRRYYESINARTNCGPHMIRCSKYA